MSEVEIVKGTLVCFVIVVDGSPSIVEMVKKIESNRIEFPDISNIRAMIFGFYLQKCTVETGSHKRGDRKKYSPLYYFNGEIVTAAQAKEGTDDKEIQSLSDDEKVFTFEKRYKFFDQGYEEVCESPKGGIMLVNKSAAA